MVRLIAHNLTWIEGSVDDPLDQCAHGRIEFTVDGHPLVAVYSGEWTLSAAALYLLRSITDDHTPEKPISEGNFLFPCCGFNVWECEQRYPVMAMGCNTGVDVWIEHHDGLVLLSTDGLSLSVSEGDWRRAVVAFVDQIEQFYAACRPKVDLDVAEDREGWAAFWKEWRARANAARNSKVE